MKKKMLSVLLASVLSVSLLAGCGSSSSSDSSDSTSEEAEEEAAEETEETAEAEESEEAAEEESAEEESAEEETASSDEDGNLDTSGAVTGGTLRIGTAQSPSVVGYTPEITNNSYIQYLRCAYESLLYYDEDGNVIGQLASDWEASVDDLTLTFTLVEGVQFSDGTDFNAEAVQWNIEQYQESGRSEVNYVDSVEVVDDYTVVINLTSWNSAALEQIGFFVYYMSPTAYEENGVEWMRVNSAGTGPFIVSDFDQGVSVSYVANENYRVEGQPYLDGIEFTIYADSTTIENSLRAGEIDMVSYADEDLRVNVQGDDTYVEETNSNGQGVESLGLIPSSADEDDPFYDANVRKALCYAVDWDAIIESLTYGLYERTNQWAVPGSITYSDDVVGYEYDPDKAMELLEEAGYADGFETTLYSFSSGIYSNMAVVIAEYLAEVGITANIEIIDTAASSDFMTNGWSGLYWHWASIGPDLGLYMGRHLDENGSYYAAGIQHPEDALELLNAVRAATTDEEKIELEKELQVLIYDEYALFGEPLYYYGAVYVRNTYVKGGEFGVAHAASWSPATCWLDE